MRGTGDTGTGAYVARRRFVSVSYEIEEGLNSSRSSVSSRDARRWVDRYRRRICGIAGSVIAAISAASSNASNDCQGYSNGCAAALDGEVGTAEVSSARQPGGIEETAKGQMRRQSRMEWRGFVTWGTGDSLNF